MTLQILMAGLILLAAIRMPVAIRHQQARPAWLAAVFGILGLLSIGVVVPMPVADGLLGGTNVLFLFRTLWPVVAFWFFREAVALQASTPPVSQVRRTRFGRRLIGLLAMVAAQVVAFFLIPRQGTTDIGFVDHHMNTVPGIAWAIIYAGEAAWIAAGMMIMLWPQRRSLFAVFIAGAAMVVLGAAALVTHCLLIFIGTVAPLSNDPAWILFNILFYPGIVVIVIGFIAVMLRDIWRVVGWRVAAFRLAAIRSQTLHMAVRDRVQNSFRCFSSHSPMSSAYVAVIELRNLEHIGEANLPARQASLVRRVERRLEQANSQGMAAW